MSEAVVLAHGVGGRADLPLPLPLVAYGAAAVLVVSFVVLGLRWRTSRLEGGVRGVLLPGVVDRGVQGLGILARIAGLTLAVVVLGVAFGGPPSTRRTWRRSPCSSSCGWADWSPAAWWPTCGPR